MRNIVPKNISEVKDSIDTWRSTFSNTFKQLVEKGKELQQVTEQFFISPIGRAFPQMDMIEGADELFLVFELPGLEKDDFKLELAGGLLFIIGEKKNPLQNKVAGLHLSECAYGRFERTVSLPCKILEEKAEAEFKNGVLTVKLPKVDAPPAQKVSVAVR
jgi:HSP20 family protein